MTTPKKMPTAPTKKTSAFSSSSVGGQALDIVGWAFGELVMPVPDFLFAKKKKAAAEASKAKKKTSWL